MEIIIEFQVNDFERDGLTIFGCRVKTAKINYWQ